MSTFDLLRFERLQQSLFPPSLKNTACVLWIGKNYRLQDIQLSKIALRNFVPQTPLLAHSRGAFDASLRSRAAFALRLSRNLLVAVASPRLATQNSSLRASRRLACQP